MSSTHSQATSGPRAANESPATHKAREAAHEAVDRAADRAEVVEDRIRKEAAHMAEKANAGKDEAMARWDDTVETLDEFVRKRPVASVGIAFGAGVLAALLLRR